MQQEHDSKERVKEKNASRGDSEAPPGLPPPGVAAAERNRAANFGPSRKTSLVVCLPPPAAWRKHVRRFIIGCPMNPSTHFPLTSSCWSSSLPCSLCFLSKPFLLPQFLPSSLFVIPCLIVHFPDSPPPPFSLRYS